MSVIIVVFIFITQASNQKSCLRSRVMVYKDTVNRLFSLGEWAFLLERRKSSLKADCSQRFLLDTLDEWRGTTLSGLQGVVWGRSSGRVWFHTSLDCTLVVNRSEMEGRLQNGIFQEDGSLPSLMKVNPGESFSTHRKLMVANLKSRC